MRLRALLLAVSVLTSVLLVGACAPGERPAAPLPPEATVETLEAPDGVLLDARLFRADPTRIVILLHGYPESQADWFDVAAWLRDRGYSALTLDFRGYGASGGQRPAEALEQDAVAAVRFARAQGYEQIVLLGGSMGGAAAIVAASQEPAVDGVIALSPPARFAQLDATSAAARMQAPLVVVVARDDTSSVKSLEALAEEARLSRAHVLEVAGETSGGALLRTGEAPRVRERVLTFLEEVTGAPSAEGAR